MLGTILKHQDFDWTGNVNLINRLKHCEDA
jgi:hypothetical protein